MNVLVTGATGKFGPILVQHLVQKQHHVRVLVHATPVAGGQIEQVAGDITNPGDVEKACEGIDCICHLATVKGDREKFLQVNVGGLYHVLEAARVSDKAPQVILLSGDNVVPIYDYEHPEKFNETTPYLFVDDEYGLSKILEEIVALQYAKKYHMPITILRSSWIMEGMRAAQLCHPRLGGWKRYLSDDLKKKLDAGENFYVVPLDIHGKPLKRHVIDPRDLAASFAWALKNKDTYGEIFHIAGPAPFDYQELAECMAKKKPAPIHRVATPDAFSFEIDIAKAGRRGFASRYTICETIDWAFSGNI